jgi:hypothetical protein
MGHGSRELANEKLNSADLACPLNNREFWSPNDRTHAYRFSFPDPGGIMRISVRTVFASLLAGAVALATVLPAAAANKSTKAAAQ